MVAKETFQRPQHGLAIQHMRLNIGGCCNADRVYALYVGYQLLPSGIIGAGRW